MNNPCTGQSQFDRRRLIAFARGQPDPELARHLAICSTCQAEVRRLQGLAAIFHPAAGARRSSVELVACEPAETRRHRCVVEDPKGGFQIEVERIAGRLQGQITGIGFRSSLWRRATVRLFGSKGFIATSVVDASGRFCLPDVSPGQRYSLALVLAWPDGGSQLKIIGDFEPR